jgi:hypothetical protein
VLAGGDGRDQLDFGTAEDVEGRDDLAGGPGDDELSGGPAQDAPDGDTLTGGEGIDQADFSARAAALTIDLDGEADDGEGRERDNVRPDVENLIGGSDGDTLVGADTSNTLDGRDGGDTIEGRGGDDMLRGGRNDAGSDTIRGGSGRDDAEGGPGDDDVTGGTGNDNLSGDGGSDTLEGDEGDDELSGGPGGDKVFGGDGNDTLYGFGVGMVGADADDTLRGGDGVDSLIAGSGDDDLDGGRGSDTMSGEAGSDTVRFAERSNPVNVTLDGQPNDGEEGATPEQGEKDNVLRDNENIVGGELGDTLQADDMPNIVEGGRGQDLIEGRLGRDELSAGTAADVVDASDGRIDDVNCGDGMDLAILDDGDQATDCEVEDRPRSRRPVAGSLAVIRAAGPFQLRLPDGPRYFNLQGSIKFPVGSTIDPEAGTVRLTAATRASGGRQRIDVAQGAFRIRQRTGRRPRTELSLAGPRPRCNSSPSARASGILDAPSSRSILVDAKPPRRRSRPQRVEVRGPHSEASTRGTKWLTEERCDGTLTTVLSGSVRVHDIGRDRDVIVRPGRPYLAAPRSASGSSSRMRPRPLLGK